MSGQPMPEDEEFVSGGVPIQTVPGLADLLNEISTAISDYVHLTNVEQNWAITLWTAHIHAIDYARITPRLAIKGNVSASLVRTAKLFTEAVRRLAATTTSPSASAQRRGDP